MDSNFKQKQDLLGGDYKNQKNDEYIKLLEEDSKKNRFLKIGMGTIYILLMLISLFII
jgi:hypothetical protein